MEYRIITDSCCDLTPKLREQLNAVTIPLSLTLGDEIFVDDDSLNIAEYMEKMRKYNGKIGSACPSPDMYKNAFVGDHVSFAITLSGNLSGSYSSAVAAKTLAEEENADVYVFDSKSASAGEILLAVKIRKMINQGIQKSSIIASIESFIKEMKTYFVLENFDNLIKNGRLSKIAGKLLSVLSIKPIMGSDGDGNIALFSHARGQKQIIEKLTDTIEKSGRPTNGESIVITHCNNQSLAEKLMDAIKRRYHFNEILIMPTRGLSSMYANEKGIIMAF